MDGELREIELDGKGKEGKDIRTYPGIDFMLDGFELID